MSCSLPELGWQASRALQQSSCSASNILLCCHFTILAALFTVRYRLRLGVGDAHGLGNTGRTLLALDLDGPLVCHADAAVWHVIGGEQLLAASDARANLHGVGETHLVRAVVYAVPHIVDPEYIPAEGSDHGQSKITVCDGLPIRHVGLAALDINMDPLMVAACFGKCFDASLCHDQPVADPQLLTDQRLHRLRTLHDSFCHDALRQNHPPTCIFAQVSRSSIVRLNTRE